MLNSSADEYEYDLPREIGCGRLGRPLLEESYCFNYCIYVVSAATKEAPSVFIERTHGKPSERPPSAWQITGNRADAFDFKLQGLAQDFCERLNTKWLAHRLPNNGRVWHVANTI